jgi:peptidoglycan/LPS O-acetylase OafA/YrhL
MVNPSAAAPDVVAYDAKAAGRRSGPTSVPLLSHLRWIAAFVVVISHIQQVLLSKTGYVVNTALPELGLVTKPIFRPEGYGHAAVVIFFVLSGFLVGGKLIDLAVSSTIHQEWSHFLLDRFTRIFTVAWPALLLTLIVLLGLAWLLPGAAFVHDSNWTFVLPAPLIADFAASRWAAAITMLNELVAPTLETNGPLWSLAYEWSYYVVGLAAVLACRRILSPAALLVIAYGAFLLLLCLVNQPDIIFSGLCWSAGAVSRVIFNRRWLRGALTQATGIALVGAVLALQRKYPTPDPVLGVALALMIAHCGWASWKLGTSLGERLAGFSYSLYAMHFPILLAVTGVMLAAGWLPQQRLPFNIFGFAAATAVLLLIVAAARLFAYFTEDHTGLVRRTMMRWLRACSAVGPSAIAQTDLQ